jgi:hypothetical protein
VPEAETIFINKQQVNNLHQKKQSSSKDSNSDITSKSVNRGVGSLKDSIEKPSKKLDQCLYCVLIGGSLHELSKMEN